jgi:hypothetical protein
MYTFKRIDSRIKLLIGASATLLLVLAVGLLLFGHNMMGHESELIHQASEATRANMLYTHPEAH